MTVIATRLEPPVTETSAPFWEATRSRRLVLQWCTHCEKAIWYPRETCPWCMGHALEWRPASGQGVVYAVTVEHKSMVPSMAALTPYTVVLVDLAEGTRMLSSVVGCPPDEVRVGMAVEVSWEELSDGRNLPMFRPVAATSAHTNPADEREA
ncbi:MAG: OB-fold domain-containing protein [Acidimicrobiales bacterium]